VKQWWRNVRPYVLSGLAFLVARALSATWRIRAVGWDEVRGRPGGKVLAGWHGRTFVAAAFFRGQGVWTIISHSKDGEMQDRIFRRFGFKTIRGSTGRGGAMAAAESIRVLRAGALMAFTPDGPRGPSGVVQPGILLMAKKSGAALVPVGVSADRRWLVRTWDRYMVPKPFAQCVMEFGEPMSLPPDSSEEEVEEFRVRFEQEIRRLEAEAERMAGHAEPFVAPHADPRAG
jgi:lysophospholipid acyltransferase (LPLAT)-like uncharacterized protein